MGDKIDIEEEHIEEFPPDQDPLVIEQEKRDEELKLKEEREDAVKKLVVTNNSIPFDANPKAQANMNSVVALLNWNFNKALGATMTQMSENPALSDEAKAMFGGIGQLTEAVYKGVYKDIKIPWRGADNVVHEVQGESICETLEKTMKTLANAIGVK